jgi:hypothetical protein
MPKFNFDLSDTTYNPYSRRQVLLPDEIKLVQHWFAEILAATDAIPDYVLTAMGDIESAFNKDKKMSEKQMKYVEDVFNKYC